MNKRFNAIITNTNDGSGDLNVFDVAGKVMLTKTLALQSGQQTISTDISSLAPGVYFVTLSGNGKTQTQKLVIMK